MKLDMSDRRLGAVIAICLVFGVASVMVGLAAGAGSGAEAARPLTFKLKERHASGVSGTATLTRVRTRMRVVLRVPGREQEALLAHIHTGPCRREPTFANPRIWISLKSVVKGRSVTSVAVTLRTLRSRAFSINVHAPDYAVIACGDVPRAS